MISAMKTRRFAAVTAVMLAGLALTGCVRGYDTWIAGVDGDGSRVQCSDGTWSNSGGKSGACSGHGGVGYTSPEDAARGAEALKESFAEIEAQQRQEAAEQARRDVAAEKQRAAALPEGYVDLGDGAAYRFTDEPCKSAALRCSAIDIEIYRDACSAVQVEYAVLDAEQREIDSGQVWKALIGPTELVSDDPAAAFVQVTALGCAW